MRTRAPLAGALSRGSAQFFQDGPGFELTSPVYHEGFQGWRYFDLESYRKRPEMKFAI